MTELNIIEKIGFEDGSYMTIDELPVAVQNDIQRYNDWTTQLAENIKQQQTLREQHALLIYARTGASSLISEAAAVIQNQRKEAAIEAHSSTDSETADISDSQDPQ